MSEPTSLHDISGNSSENILLSTIIHDISGVSSSTFLLSTLQADLSGNQGLLSTLVYDLSGVLTSSIMMSIITQDLSGALTTILSINDLLNSHEATVIKEVADRAAVNAFTTPSIDSLRPTLYKWASEGFPGVYPVNSLSLQPPQLCVDGVSRTLLFYFEYLYGSPIETWLQGLEKITQGMDFTFSHDGASKITLHVTRT